MKTILFLSVLLVGSFSHADQYVNGYVRSNGTVVQPYVRTSPNNTVGDNYSTRGNTNPYTGQPGRVSPRGY